MKIKICRYRLKIIPENSGYPNYNKLEIAYIEEVLGLKNEGDSVKLVRRNVSNSHSLAYLDTDTGG